MIRHFENNVWCAVEFDNFLVLPTEYKLNEGSASSTREIQFALVTAIYVPE